MPNDSKYPWFIFDLLIFAAVNVLVLWWIKPPPETIKIFSPWLVILFGLAVFRGADIVSNEPIFAPVREPFMRHLNQDGKDVERPLKFGFRGAMGSLLYCPACTGVWVAMVLVYGYLLAPGVFGVVIAILAISGVERLVTNFYNIEKKVPKTLRSGTVDKP